MRSTQIILFSPGNHLLLRNSPFTPEACRFDEGAGVGTEFDEGAPTSTCKESPDRIPRSANRATLSSNAMGFGGNPPFTEKVY